MQPVWLALPLAAAILPAAAQDPLHKLLAVDGYAGLGLGEHAQQPLVRRGRRTSGPTR